MIYLLVPHPFSSGPGDSVGGASRCLNVREVVGKGKGLGQVVPEEKQRDLYDFCTMLHNGVMMASFLNSTVSLKHIY